jgi:hypothetical protein
MGLNVNHPITSAPLYVFNGPFTHVDGLLRQSGVYLISVVENGLHQVLDIGESNDIHTRIKNHDRESQWLSNNGGRQLHVSSYYCDEPTRMVIERQLRSVFNPVCGER